MEILNIDGLRRIISEYLGDLGRLKMHEALGLKDNEAPPLFTHDDEDIFENFLLTKNKIKRREILDNIYCTILLLAGDKTYSFLRGIAFPLDLGSTLNKLFRHIIIRCKFCSEYISLLLYTDLDHIDIIKNI